MTVDFATCSFSPDKDREVVTVTIACEHLVAFLLIWREVERLPSDWRPLSMRCPSVSVSVITPISGLCDVFIITGYRSGSGANNTCMRVLCGFSLFGGKLIGSGWIAMRFMVTRLTPLASACYSFSQDQDREMVTTIPACEYFMAFLLIWRKVDRLGMICDTSYVHPPKPSPICMVLTLFPSIAPLPFSLF